MEKEESEVKNNSTESIQNVDLSTLLYIQPTYFSLIETRYRQIEKKEINVEQKKCDGPFAFPVHLFYYQNLFA